MKTIFVVFGNLCRAEAYISAGTKRYCFRTEGNLEVGDVLDSQSYETPMTVVNIIDKDYKYFNKVTGELSTELTSTCAYPIKTIELIEVKKNVVYAAKQNCDE